MATKRDWVEHADILHEKQYFRDLVEKHNDRLFVKDASKIRLDVWIPHPGKPSIERDTGISKDLLIDE